MSSDPDLKATIAQYKMLSTANLSDGLDRVGVNGTPHGIGPLWDSCPKIVGPAATLKLVLPRESGGEAEESPVLGTLEAVKRGNLGDVLVSDGSGSLDDAELHPRREAMPPPSPIRESSFKAHICRDAGKVVLRERHSWRTNNG